MINSLHFVDANSMSEDYLFQNTLPHPKSIEGWIRTRPGLFQLSLFDQNDAPTQLEVLAGSSAILTMAQLHELKSRLASQYGFTLLGPVTPMACQGYLGGVPLFLTHHP